MHLKFNNIIILILPIVVTFQKVNRVYSQKNHTYEIHLAGESYFHHNEYAGSQFLIDQWVRGDVYLSNGEKAQGQLLKYNSYLDELIWLEPSSLRQVKLDKGLVDKFKLVPVESGDSLHFVKWKNERGQILAPTNVFLEKIYKGDLTLFGRRQIQQTGRMESVFLGGRGQQRILIALNTTYYLLLPNERLAIVNFNRNSLARVLKSLNSAIEPNVLRRHGVRLRTEDDLVKAIKWFEETGQFL